MAAPFGWHLCGGHLAVQVLLCQQLQTVGERSDAQKWTRIGFSNLRLSTALRSDNPTISDHNMVLACFDIGFTESTPVIRKVFDYDMADWTGIK